MAPEKIGRYQVIREAGRGGMASVFLAHDPRFGRDVAVKVLPEQFLHDPTFRGRFEREARTIAQLEHPAIVPVYDFGEQDGQPFLVMRYMSGGTLLEKMRQGALPIDQIVEILRRIGSALDYAHSKGIVHRDLKPANILFDQHGNAFLTDFGIVRLAESTATYTGSAIVGTPAYMSPEQVHGDKTIDGRSDIYSLGVITFEMLTGQAPYHADTPAKLMMAHVLNPVPNVHQYKQNIPADCQMVVNRAMAKDRDERFSTASELALTLGGVSGRPVAGPSVAAADKTVLEPFPIPPRNVPPTGAISTNAPTSVDVPSQPWQQPSIEQESPAPAKKGFPMWIPVVGCAFLLFAGVVLLIGGYVVSQIRAETFVAETAEAESATSVARAATEEAEFITAEAIAALAEAEGATAEAVAGQTAEAAAALTSEAQEANAAATQEAVETISASQTAVMESLNATNEALTVEANDPTLALYSTGQEWPQVLFDPFDADVNDWCLGEASSEFAEGNRDITGGKYVWETTGLQDFFRYCGNEIFAQETNFFVSADIHLVSGPSTSQYGLLIRRQDGDNHIIFRIEDSGRFQVRIQLDGDWETIIDWTDSAFIRSGQVNELAVVGEGSHFTLFINGAYVGEFDESRLSGGYGGFFISLDEGVTAVIEFDNYVLNSP